MTEIYKPIGFLKEPVHWESVPIVECGEKMIPLSRLPDRYFVLDSKYYHQGIPGALQESYVRETVFELLMKAARNLPEGYQFIIWDAWRPIEVQEFLFNGYLAELALAKPDLDTHRLREIAREFVSPPSYDDRKPSPHNTGGAIDLTVIDSSGKELDMKTSFDNFTHESSTRYFEAKLEQGDKLSPEEIRYLNNRRFLFHLMTETGFTNYPFEWWHYDYGNQFWGSVTNNIACYGKIVP